MRNEYTENNLSVDCDNHSDLFLDRVRLAFSAFRSKRLFLRRGDICYYQSDQRLRFRGGRAADWQEVTAMSVYYAPGSISAYVRIKKVVDSFFSDRRKFPFATLHRRRDKLSITIYYSRNEKTENEIPLENVERLEALYDNLRHMAYGR